MTRGGLRPRGDSLMNELMTPSRVIIINLWRWKVETKAVEAESETDERRTSGSRPLDIKILIRGHSQGSGL